MTAISQTHHAVSIAPETFGGAHSELWPKRASRADYNNLIDFINLEDLLDRDKQEISGLSKV